METLINVSVVCPNCGLMMIQEEPFEADKFNPRVCCNNCQCGLFQKQFRVKREHITIELEEVGHD